MTYEIVVETATARPMAAVRRRVQAGGVAAAWKPALDQVWAFLRQHEGLRTDGHNVFVYHDPARPGDPLDVDFGVEVSGPFEGEGDVAFTYTPAGETVSTLHVGSYEGLADAHRAIDAWRAAHGRAFGDASWEAYGHPAGDPERVDIRVSYLLA